MQKIGYYATSLVLLVSFSAAASNDFLSDYSLLVDQADGSQLYKAPNLDSILKGYDSIMVDQPEVFLGSNSKYKGMKPDDMKIIVDSFQESIKSELQDSYKIVESPGPGVLFLRLALVDVYLKKAKRGLLSYTPGGALKAIGMAESM